MKVELIEYTGNGRSSRAAAELLVFTKSTRLDMSPSLIHDISGWSDDRLWEELEYMSNTIPSSWEFVDYVFLISKCTRAFTHQLVRNRHGSYAQQTMRILDVEGFSYEIGPTIESDENRLDEYCNSMEIVDRMYSKLIKDGAAIEDARGILPTNIHTNIVCKFNLRTISEMVAKRSSPRVQGEYRNFIRDVANLILEVHPWAKFFLRDRKSDAARKLDEFISEAFDGVEFIDGDDEIKMIKLVDILRG